MKYIIQALVIFVALPMILIAVFSTWVLDNIDKYLPKNE